MAYRTLSVWNCLGAKRDYPGADRFHQWISSSTTMFGAWLMDGACGWLLQPTWKRSQSYLRRTQWHSLGTIFTLRLQSHVQSSRVRGSPGWTKACQRGQWPKSSVPEWFQGHRRIDKQVFQIWDSRLLKYYYAFERLKEEFEEVQVTHISWENNDKAEDLAWLVTSPKPGQLKTFTLHPIPIPSVSGNECL